jgi:hypothetical protein
MPKLFAYVQADGCIFFSDAEVAGLDLLGASERFSDLFDALIAASAEARGGSFHVPGIAGVADAEAVMDAVERFQDAVARALEGGV